MTSGQYFTNGSYFNPKVKTELLDKYSLTKFEYYDSEGKLRTYKHDNYNNYTQQRVNKILVDLLSQYSTSNSPEITKDEWYNLMLNFPAGYITRCKQLEMLGEKYSRKDSDGGENITFKEIDLILDELEKLRWFKRTE